MNTDGNTQTDLANQPGKELNRIGIRVPPFWPEKPKLWFCQLECQFNLNGITRDSTKFWYVVSQLDNRYICTGDPGYHYYTTGYGQVRKGQN